MADHARRPSNVVVLEQNDYDEFEDYSELSFSMASRSRPSQGLHNVQIQNHRLSSTGSSGGGADLTDHSGSGADPLSLQEFPMRGGAGKRLSLVSGRRSSMGPSVGSSRHPIAPAQAESRLKHLPIAQLKTSRTALHGRQKEMETLRSCLHNMTEKQQQQICFISGYSGAGKSALAQTLFTNSMASKKIKNTQSILLCVSGKFDVLNRNEPYSAIIMAVQEICGTILRWKNKAESSAKSVSSQNHHTEKSQSTVSTGATGDDYDEVSSMDPKHPISLERLLAFSKDLRECLGSEMPLLLEMIPVIEEILFRGDHDDDEFITNVVENNENAHRIRPSTSEENSKNRLNYAYQRLFRIVSKHFSLVLLLDDLQMVDMPSLTLLDMFLADPSTRQMMILGTYRSNEVTDETHILRRALAEWRLNQEQNQYTLTEIEIGNLSPETVLSMVQDMLNTDEAKISELATLCYKKTQGNAFFLKLLLSTLYEMKLLQYNFGIMGWTWDMAEIEEQIPRSANVIDLVISTMSQLEARDLYTLQIAACLGSKFEVDLLQLTFDQLYKDAVDPVHNVHQSLSNVLEKEGYVEQAGHSSFQFSHDKIQEACIALLSSQEDRNDLFQRVGLCLFSHMETEGNVIEASDSLIFIATDLLNKGTPPSDDSMKLKMANLNCLASKRAMAVSAFEAASAYAQQGISLLHMTKEAEKRWKHHFELSLELYSTGAQSEHSIGNAAAMEAYCNEVISQREIPIEDKFRVYHALMANMGSRGMVKEAAEKGVELLRNFGCKFPVSKFSIMATTVAQLVSIKSSVKGFIQDKLTSLPMMQDPTRKELMKLVDRVATFWYVNDDPRFPLAMFRSFFWTKAYGLSIYTPAALGTVAIVLAGVLEDFESSHIVGLKAIELMEQLDAESRLMIQSRVSILVHGMVLAWSTPFKDRLDDLSRGYQTGLKSGDTESASLGVFMFTSTRFNSGVPLGRVATDAKAYAIQMKNLKQIPALQVLEGDLQMYLILMFPNHDSIDPTILCGEVFSAEEADRRAKEDGLFFSAQIRNEALLCTFFGAHQKLADIVLKAKGKDLPLVGTPNLMYHALARGVSSFAAYRKTNVKGYERMGILMRSKVKGWAKKKNPNVLHFDKLLDGEYFASIGKVGSAIESFQEAIRMSARIGCIQDAALACERFGHFSLEQGDMENAKFQLEQAIDYYRSWDALAKVRQIESQFPNMFPAHPQTINVSAELTTLAIGPDVHSSSEFMEKGISFRVRKRRHSSKGSNGNRGLGRLACRRQSMF